MFYTVKEKTEKKWTVDDVLSRALVVLNDKYKLQQVCCNTVKDIRNQSELFTTVRLNELIEQVIDDTLYYDGWKITN